MTGASPGRLGKLQRLGCFNYYPGRRARFASPRKHHPPERIGSFAARRPPWSNRWPADLEPSQTQYRIALLVLVVLLVFLLLRRRCSVAHCHDSDQRAGPPLARSPQALNDRHSAAGSERRGPGPAGASPLGPAGRAGFTARRNAPSRPFGSAGPIKPCRTIHLAAVVAVRSAVIGLSCRCYRAAPSESVAPGAAMRPAPRGAASIPNPPGPAGRAPGPTPRHRPPGLQLRPPSPQASDTWRWGHAGVGRTRGAVEDFGGSNWARPQNPHPPPPRAQLGPLQSCIGGVPLSHGGAVPPFSSAPFGAHLPRPRPVSLA